MMLISDVDSENINGPPNTPHVFERHSFNSLEIFPTNKLQGKMAQKQRLKVKETISVHSYHTTRWL